MKSIIKQARGSSLESSSDSVSISERMGLKGYRLSAATDIDMTVCLTSSCAECGHVELRAIGFRNDNPYSYRVFAFCPECKFWEEF